MTTWRQRLVAYERDAPFPVQSPVKGFWKKSGQRSYAPSRYSSEAEWSGNRLLTGSSKVRFLPLEPSLPTREGHTRKNMLVRIQLRVPIHETDETALTNHDSSRRNIGPKPPSPHGRLEGNSPRE